MGRDGAGEVTDYRPPSSSTDTKPSTGTPSGPQLPGITLESLHFIFFLGRLLGPFLLLTSLIKFKFKQQGASFIFSSLSNSLRYQLSLAVLNYQL